MASADMSSEIFGGFFGGCIDGRWLDEKLLNFLGLFGSQLPAVFLLDDAVRFAGHGFDNEFGDGLASDGGGLFDQVGGFFGDA